MMASVAALQAAGEAALGRRQYAVAEAFYRQATAKAPRNATLWLGLGIALASQATNEQLAEGGAAIGRAQKLAPASAEPDFHAGTIAARQGDLSAAMRCYRSALAKDGRHLKARFALASLLQGAGDFDAAVAAYEVVLKYAPRAAEAANNIASIRITQGKPEAALIAIDRALAAAPHLLEAWHNKALVHEQLGDVSAGVDAYARLLSLAPEHGDARKSYARLLAEAGRLTEARAEYQTLVTGDAADAESAHHLAALSGVAPNSAPAGYVAAVFDAMAPRFDQHLGALGYRIPERVAELLASLGTIRQLTLLDIGCGTGLLGRALTASGFEIAATGLDLSKPMLQRTRATGLYSELIEAEANDWLAASAASGHRLWDVIALLDVVTYTGDPVPTLTAAVRCLAPGGMLAVCAELGDDVALFALHPTARYQHSASGIEALLAQLGLKLVASERLSLRSERGKPTPGALWVAQKGWQ